jgi:hypothetical protein
MCRKHHGNAELDASFPSRKEVKAFGANSNDGI